MEAWSIIAGDVILWTLAIVATFEGSRRFKRGHGRRASVILVAAGIAFAAVRGAIGFTIGSMAPDIETHRSQSIAELDADQRAQLPSAEREKSSLAYAAAAYKDTGRLLQYFERSGERRRFSPTPEQLREREFNVEVLQRMEDTATYLQTQGAAAIASIVIAAIAGIVVGRKNENDRAAELT